MDANIVVVAASWFTAGIVCGTVVPMAVQELKNKLQPKKLPVDRTKLVR